MTYRISKNCFYEDSAQSCSIFESSNFQLQNLNHNLADVADKLIKTQDFCDFDPMHKDCRQAIYELGCVTDRAVMSNIYNLEGYHKLHAALKKINADFHFQILPSAGTARPVPVLMIVVKRFCNYAANMTARNRHMYPDFGVNDNGGPAGRARDNAPIHFRFA